MLKYLKNPYTMLLAGTLADYLSGSDVPRYYGVRFIHRARFKQKTKEAA